MVKTLESKIVGSAPKGHRGFTLIELMVVMTILSLLIAIAVPRYFHSVEVAKESTLKQNLSVMRDAIDKFYGDNDRYPNALDELVSKRYIRSVPVDPITDNASSWITIAPEDESKGLVYDVKSGALGNAIDGTPFSDW